MVRPGDRVGDRYEVIEQLASGGMGTLWRARHVELDVDVALKVVSSGGTDPQALERFRREAKAAARLRSPHIVQVLDYGTFEGSPFLAMELLRGEDLATCIAREGRMEPARCARIMKSVAKAVQFAHDEGVLHRDLKPANIFLERVGPDEVVKVLDFGVAKDLRANDGGSHTTTGALVGSPAYMSPEQVWSHGIGYPSDVWAMGVVAFEMLTGKNPFDDTTLAKVFERIVRQPLPSACALCPQLPPSIDAFFEHALARAVAARVRSPMELADEFAEALRGHSPEALIPAAKDASAASTLAQTQRRPRPERGTRRRRVVAVLVGLLALGAIGVALLAGNGPPAEVAPSLRASDAREVPTKGPPLFIPSASAGGPAGTPAPGDPASPGAAAAVPAPRAAATKGNASRPSPRRPPAPSAVPSIPLDPRFGIPTGG